jgi:putative transposase
MATDRGNKRMSGTADAGGTRVRTVGPPGATGGRTILDGLGVRQQLRTPRKAPRANALAECWVRSARTECLHHLFIVHERHLQWVLDEYVAYFNAWRPHQGLGQRAPGGSAPTARPARRAGSSGSRCWGACIMCITMLPDGRMELLRPKG